MPHEAFKGSLQSEEAQLTFGGEKQPDGFCCIYLQEAAKDLFLCALKMFHLKPSCCSAHRLPPSVDTN